MSGLRSQVVNLCGDDPSLWQAEPAGEGAEFRTPGLGAGSPLALLLSRPGRWKSAPRHAEPYHPYLLECDVRGEGRIGLVWVREGRPLTGRAGRGPFDYDQGRPALDSRQVYTSPDDAPRFAHLTQVGAVWSQEFKAEEWERVTVSGLSPCAANRVQVVLEALGEREAAFDHPYLDGLGAAPVEIVLPAGFHANSSKVAVVAVRERASRGKFELLYGGEAGADWEPGTAAGWEPALRGPLLRWGQYLWGREYWNADFSGVTRPGSYRLRVTFEDGREAISPEFRISPDLYLTLPNLTLTWFYTQRCGVEVPGWHPACHLDDALLGRSRNRPLGPGGEWTITGEADLTGGWHDAGDNHKYICWSYLALWALARLQGIQPGELRRPGEGPSASLRTGLPDPLAEACWEARFLLKTASEDGLYPLGVISRFGWVNTPIHEETDNIRNSGDERALPDPHERICDLPTYGPELTSALVSSSLADLALALRGYRESPGGSGAHSDDDLAGADLGPALLAAAERTWDHHHQAEPPDAEYLRWHAAFALLDAALHRHGPRAELREDLEARVERIIAQQRPEGVFPFPRSCADYREQVFGLPGRNAPSFLTCRRRGAGIPSRTRPAALTTSPRPSPICTRCWTTWSCSPMVLRRRRRRGRWGWRWTWRYRCRSGRHSAR